MDLEIGVGAQLEQVGTLLRGDPARFGEIVQSSPSVAGVQAQQPA